MSAPPPTTSEHQPSLEHLLLRFGLVTLDQLSLALREQAEIGTPFADSLVRDGIVSADDLARVADRAPALDPPTTETAPTLPSVPFEDAGFEPTPSFEGDPPAEPFAAAEPEPAPEPARPAVRFTTVPPADLVAPPLSEPVAEPPLSYEEPAHAPEPAWSFEAPAAVEPAPEPESVQAPPVSQPEPTPAPTATGFVVRGHLVNGEDVEIASVEDADEAQRIARDAMRACARTDGSDWPILNGRYVRPESIVSIEVAERA